MNKILVTIYVFAIETQYDILIPINIKVKDAIELLQDSIIDLSGNSYVKNPEAVLYDGEGKIINPENIVKFSGLKNGSKLLLV